MAAERNGPPGPGPAIYARVHELVRLIPPGYVTTYGDIALALGWPRHARLVGYAMSMAPDGVPAHRVVNHRGEASRAWGGGHPEEQIALLRAEGVTFTAAGRVDLRRHICDLVALRERAGQGRMEGDGLSHSRQALAP